MANPTILVSTWSDGVCVLRGDARTQELAGEAVRGLTPDGRGGALAIVGGHALRRRAADGSWSTLATSSAALSCCVAVGDVVCETLKALKALYILFFLIKLKTLEAI